MSGSERGRSLAAKIFADGLRVARMRAESVNDLGREGDEPGRAEDHGGALDGLGLRRMPIDLDEGVHSPPPSTRARQPVIWPENAESGLVHTGSCATGNTKTTIGSRTHSERQLRKRSRVIVAEDNLLQRIELAP